MKNNNKTNSSRFANELQKRMKSVSIQNTDVEKKNKKLNRKGFILTETSVVYLVVQYVPRKKK